MLSRKSVVPSSRETNKEGFTGPPKEYAPGTIQMEWRVNNNPEDRKAIDERFKNTLDHNGKSMAEVCRDYWEKKRRAR